MKPISDTDPQVTFKSLVFNQRTVASHTAPWIEVLPEESLHDILRHVYETEVLPANDVVLIDIISKELNLPEIPADLSNADAVNAYYKRHKEIASKLADEANRQISAERESVGEVK